MRPLLLLLFTVAAAVRCPDGTPCDVDCCFDGDRHYCCHDDRAVDHSDDQSTTAREVYIVGQSGWMNVHWGAIIAGIIISIIISIILSLLCCFFCNGCWWHRRRNPEFYAGSGFPFGGTVVISSHPPFIQENGNRKVRFDENGYPRSALKKNGRYEYATESL